MRVIAVDDEKMSLMRLQRMLSEMPGTTLAGGYQSPAEALACQAEARPEVAFLDVEMPEMNGLELAERLMENDANIEVVFVTAHERYALQAYQQNAIGYLLKPVQSLEIQRQLDRVLRYRVIQAREQSGLIRAHVFGSFFLYQGVDASCVLGFRTEKSAELLALLINERGKPISRDLICERLWPDMSAERAARNFHTTAYNIRHTFSALGRGDVLLRTQNSYRLNLQCVQSDLETFCAAMKKGTQEKDWLLAAEAALAVYTGGYMADRDYVWLAEHQAYYERMFEKLCLRITQEYERCGRLDSAADTAFQWLSQNPLSEEACGYLISLYQKRGEGEKAKTVFSAFRDRCEQELGEEPSESLGKLLLR